MTGKNILILSPQPWVDLKLSKHHYAASLAEMGNHVLFVNAPEKGIGWGSKLIVPDSSNPTLKILKTKFPLPEFLKFKARELYISCYWQMIKPVIRKTLGRIDICIDFGHYGLFNGLQKIEARKKIFFPVDDFENLPPDMRGADIGFSVSKVIVDKFRNAGHDFHFINHGLSDDFVQGNGLQSKTYTPGKKLKIGYSGNLLIRFLDRELFYKVISENPEHEFHLFGKMDPGNNVDDLIWAEKLKSLPNTVLHGMLNTVQLAEAMQEMDAFMLVYIPDNKNYHAENSHKILEYLSTGKVIISTWISIYEGSGLLEMTGKLEHKEYSALFRDVLENIARFNAPELQKKRISFALDNTYTRQIERIEEWTEGLV